MVSLAVPASAIENYSDSKPVAVLSVDGVEGSNPNALLPGQKVTVNVVISGLTIEFNSIQMQLNYDTSKFELLLDDYDEFDYSSNCADIKTLFDSSVIGSYKEPGYLTMGSSTSEMSKRNYSSYLKEEDGTELIDITALSATFVVREEAVGQADFYLSQENGTDTKYEIGYIDSSTVTTSTDDLRETVNVAEPNSITITGDDTIAAPEAISGSQQSKDVQYNAVVIGKTSVIENPVVTWEISGDSESVTIDNNGKVTVKSGATAGEYTITAKAASESNEGLSSDVTATKVIKVTKETSLPSRIEGNEPGEDFDTNLEIPADNAADKTVQFSINVWDQYGELMSGPEVTWTLAPNDVPGVTLSNDGLLTITNEAKTSIDTTGTAFTISASCGELGPMTTTVTVKRSDPVATSIEIYKGSSVVTSDSIAIPQTDSTSVVYTAKVLDQYGSEMSGASVTWSTEGTVPSNVAIDDGTVTVPAGAQTGSFSLKATSDTAIGSVDVNVAKISFGADEDIEKALTISDAPTYGMTWGEIVSVTGEISATVGNAPVEGTYSVKDSDAKPSVGGQKFTIVFNGDGYTDLAVYTGTVTIEPMAVTVTGITVDDKIYDGDTDATVSTVNAVVSVDDVAITGATGTFVDANVGDNKEVNVTITLDNSNYVVDDMTLHANINPATLTADVTQVDVSKVYDGTTDPGDVSGSASVTGTVGGETVTVNVSAGDYADKNVGNNKSVTLTLSLGGDDANNYTLSNKTAVIETASITPSSSITDATNKTQNVVVGVGAFTEPKFTGVNGEEVTGTVTYSYDGSTSYGDIVEKLKSLNKDDTATISYTFTASGNYSGEITGTINVKMVDILFTVNGEPATKDNAVKIKENPTYGDTWSSIVTINDNIAATLNGSTVSGYYKLKETGTPKAGAQNFTLQFVSNDKTYDVFNGTVQIEKLELGFSAVVNEKTYDGNNTAQVKSTTLIGCLSGDEVNVNWTSATFDNENAGTDKQVTISGITLEGSDKDNYNINGTYTTTASITPESVTINGVTAEDKTYDGNTTADVDISGASIVGVIAGDTVTIQPGTGTFASADVGTGIVVTFTGFSLTGTDSGNYTLQAQPVSTTADITKADYTGTPNTVNVNILINQEAAQTGSVSLDQFFQTVPAGAIITSVTPVTVSVMDSVAVEDGVINYSSNANLETEGVTDTYSVIIETKNYNDVTATLTFTTVAKTPVIISGVGVIGAGKTYDGKAVSYTGTPVAKTNDGTTVETTGTYSYVWQEADGTALASAPKDAGSYKLVITLDDPAYIGSAEVSFTIAKAKITITAEDAEAYTGSDMPKLSYTVTGLATSESLAVNPTLTCNADMDKPGEYAITASGAAVPATGNYNETITYVPGTLTVSRRPINVGPTYDIDVVDSDNGSVKASLGNASEGSVITLTATPDDGYKLGSITVIDENGDEVEVRRSGSEYKFTMPDSDVRVSARFVRDTGALPFNDVNAGDWFYDYVEYVYNNGIMDGVDNGVFSPNTETTRGMVVTILYRLAGEPNVRGGNDFSDVASGAYYADAVTWASNAGIVNGTSATTFSPNALVTREQFAAMLYRYMSYIGEDVSASTNLNRYTDAGSVSAYAETAMSWAVAEGIINGRTATTLAPAGNCTRAEVAAMITRVFG